MSKLFDFHISFDEVSFFDIWQNSTGVSLHLGKLRVDLCFPRLFLRGLHQRQRAQGHAATPHNHRVPQGSRR